MLQRLVAWRRRVDKLQDIHHARIWLASDFILGGGGGTGGGVLGHLSFFFDRQGSLSACKRKKMSAAKQVANAVHKHACIISSHFLSSVVLIYCHGLSIILPQLGHV